MPDTITVKQLAAQAGVEGRTLRRILRARFPRETKGKTWEWQPGDPQIESILKAVSGRKPNQHTGTGKRVNDGDTGGVVTQSVNKTLAGRAASKKTQTKKTKKSFVKKDAVIAETGKAAEESK